MMKVAQGQSIPGQKASLEVPQRFKPAPDVTLKSILILNGESILDQNENLICNSRRRLLAFSRNPSMFAFPAT